MEGTITFVPPDERGGRVPWRGASSVNLAELLGRPLACYAVGSALVHVERYERELTLHWPANVADCGIAMMGQYRADTIVGDWTEVSFSGPVTLGRFRLVRVRE